MRVILVLLSLIAFANAVSWTTAYNCTSFCAAIEGACGTSQATGAGYFNLTGCGIVCNIFMASSWIGDTADTQVNTLGCRAHYLALVIATPSTAATNCPYVSLLGGSKCGNATDKCAIYCALELATCSETFQIQTGNPATTIATTNATICGLACAGYAGVGGFPQTGTEFNPFDGAGDTVQCRAYHAVAAAVVGNAAHCPHTTPVGGGVCGGTNKITNFCNNVNLICNLFRVANGLASLYPYASVAACITTAGTYDTSILGTQWGWVNSTGGDDLGCRAYHGGYPSIADGTTHCPHAGEFSVPCGGRTAGPTSAPTTAAPTTTSSATSVIANLFVVVAMLALLF